jgi:glyoxylase-like metal-dependent hydrolase (beta-lactamase superfamily II)
VTEIIPGIYQIKTPLPSKDILFGYVNAYAVQGEKGYLLVDAGLNTEEAFNSLEEQLADIGIEAKDISQIVVTHIHPDHYGLAGRLKQISGAKIAMHHLEKKLIDSRYVHMNALLRQVANWLHINGVPDALLPELQAASVGIAKFVAPAKPDIILHGGETISNGLFSFEVLWTAGHSPGHISLYEPNRKMLISGDHILPTITPNIGLHPQSGDNPLDDYLDALNAVKQLDVKIVLPGHENPFTGLKSRIDELFKHHKQRKSEILNSIKTGHKTACQIATEIPWMLDMGGARWEDLTSRDKRLAVLETAAHLESLRVDGKISKFSRDGIMYYQSI